MNHGRFDYLPIAERPKLTMPNGARVAVWVVPNIEHYHYDKHGVAMAAMTANFKPDVFNYAWRDYGARVGVWRVNETLERQGFVATAALNAEVCIEYPQMIEAGNKLGWEWMAHGLNNSTLFTGIDEDEERAAIAQTIDTIKSHTGQMPRGWLGPALTETHNTLDLLAEAGISYVADWCNDELPYEMRVRTGSMYAIPYSIEGDIQEFFLRGNTGPDFERLVTDQFDVLYRDGEKLPRVMCIALHPFIVGHPFRALYLERALERIRKHDKVWITTGGAIIDWYRAEMARLNA